MAVTICTVSGVIKTLEQSPMTQVTIKARTIRPFVYPDGTFVPDYEVSTTTDNNGAWSLALGETETPGDISIIISIEYSSGSSGVFKRNDYPVIVPDQASVDFADLINPPASP